MDAQDERPSKRFKHQSYRESLKSVHVPSTASRSALDDDIADTECHFKLALDHWRQLDLTPVFNNFADRVYPLSASVALLLHHAKDIVAFWLEAIAEASGDTLRTLFDLLQKLLHDLRDTLQSYFTSLLNALLRPLSQNPSPDVLSTLLATLSLLFKHLLKIITVPNIEDTWHSFSAALIKCNSEIQRALSEVWASILRRLKEENRKEVLQIMLRDLPSLRDTITWTFVYAFQSVARTLHTCTPPLFEDLLCIYISNKDRAHSEILLKRLITSLSHHCENPGQFSPFADVLISKYLSCNAEEQQPLMVVLAIMFSVRKGSRLSQKQISSVLLHIIQQRSLPSEHLLETIALGVACLMAGDMAVWMGPGRKFIEYSWEHPHFGLKLSEVLSALDWGGWSLIESPLTSTHSLRLMKDHLIPTFSLLSALSKSGKFNHFNENTMTQFASHIVKRLETWKFPESSMEEMEFILNICSMLPSTKCEIERIADEALDFTPAVTDQIDDSIIAKTFGRCLNVLGKGAKPELLDASKITRWCMSALKRWPRSLPVLQGLICISERQKIAPLIPLGDIYLLLKENILSHTHTLRLDTLKFLGSSIVDKERANATLNQCILGESARLDISGVRERLVRITGLPRILKADDEISVDLTIRWLVAQFKVNLRPVWSPTVKALTEVAQRCGEQVWKFVFLQLEGILSGIIISISPQIDSDVHHQGMSETERSWKDPSALKLATVVRGCMELQHKASDIEERFDASNFENRLLETLQETPSLTERHNADIIRLFLTFGSPDLPTRPPRLKLKSWLTLFSKLDNPRAFHKTETLQLLYRNLLSHPDRELQTLSLTCVLNYKSPRLLPYAEHFHAVLDDARLREHLTTFDPDTVEDSHRGEVFDILIRLFFGLMLDRHGFNRRAALLDVIGRCRDEELEILVNLMLGPFSMDIAAPEFSPSSESDEKQELGFLNLLRDVLKRLGSRITAHWSALINTIIRLVANAQNKITAPNSAGKDIKDPQEEGEDMEDVNAKTGPHIYRSVRLLGVRCFTDFFRCNVQYDFTPFLPSAFNAVVRPRMTLFEQENIQSSSAILELFFIWSSRKEFVHFLAVYDERVLPKIYTCLLATNVKPVVITRVFDIIENLIRFAEEDRQVAETILKPHIHILLSSLMVQLSGELLHRQISILSRVAQFASDQAQAKRVLSQFVPLLKKPVKAVSEKIKTDILIIVRTLVPFVYSAKSFDEADSNGLSDQLYQVVSMLFQNLRYRSSRSALLSVFRVIAEHQVDLGRVSGIIESLNAFSARRIEEPDFERRLGAYSLVNEQLYSELTSREWLLLLYNMLFFIQDPDELIIRTNAAFSMKRFVEVLCTKEDQNFNVIFTKTLFPALKNGLRAKSELVRNEILSVLAFSIQKCQEIDVLNELRPLLAQGDVEADFFNNIYHIQTHRRVRALRRLSDHVTSGSIRSTTVSEIFVPIINHFIMNASTTDHILVDVAISALGSMARQLNWAAYSSLVRLYLGLVKDKESIQRAFVRALISVLENFHFCMDDDVSIEEAHDIVPEDSVEALPVLVNGAEKQLSQKSKISEAVNTRLLPSLLHYLESRDDNEDALRIPISVGIAQITLHLPDSTRNAQITRLLTIISQVFRSKSFETRKLARDVLCRIIILVGPSYLPTAVTELRTALQRGSHLHILSTVIHTIVNRITSSDAIGSFKTLDSCATDIANTASEVIFGQSGKDVQSEGFTTTVQEVRGSSSKGIESLVILSRHITSARLSSLLNPIKGIMHETTASKTMQLVDDVIRRISAGLSANKYISNIERLSLCHTLVEQNARFLQETRLPREKTVRKDFAVQTKRQLGKDEDCYTINKYRFVVLGLDIFNVAFRRGNFDLKDPEIISRLETMAPVIGNSLYSQDSSVIIQALKATVFIIKCPLKAVNDSLPVFIKQIMHLVKQASSTESEVVQAAFRTLAVIIRDCSSSRIGETDLVFLIELLAPDLEEPMRQAAIFGLLRAIVSRRMVIVEIYDLMDKVAEIMVTNQARQVQEMCRNVLLQFLLDYPQGQGRLRKQMTFLTKNLSYPFESGRLSVMELLAAILAKFDKALLYQYAEMFFVALVMVMANDDSSKCKEMAASLIRLLFDQLDIDKRKDIVSRLHVWCSGKSSTRLACVSSQVYGLLVENDKKKQVMDVFIIIKDMIAVVDFSLAEFERLESKASDESVSAEAEADFSWQLPYHALNTLYKCLREYTEYLFGQTIHWEAIYSHLVYPHAWVRNVASKLVGLLFNAVSPFSPKLATANDKQLSHINLKQIALNCCIQLKSDTLDSNLGLQVVKNLFFIGKCFALVDQTNDLEPTEPENEEVTLHVEDNPLSWLFTKLSYQIRSNLLARRNRFKNQSNWCEQSLTILHWFAAMTSHLPSSLLQRYLGHMLNPIYRILEDDTIHDDSMEKLKTLATELLDLVQGKAGTTNFSEAYNAIKQHVTMVRQERKAQAAVRAGKDPQNAFKRKIARNLIKKKSRSRKADFLAGKKRRFDDNSLRLRRR